MTHSVRIRHGDYQALADLRYQIRRFLHFSEQAARNAGLEPRQHQLLLALRGAPEDGPATVGYLAERLQVEHHSAVELVDRMESHGLVRRTRNEADRRQVIVHLTRTGEGLLERLSVSHLADLRENGPALVRSLQALIKSYPEERHNGR